jgi:SAM-dependent methyltransferase
VSAVPDPIFTHSRLAAVYDPLDPDRGDLDVYAAVVREYGARRVLDIGCGTGTFAIMLAAAGHEVVGLDPAEASLEVARSKPGSSSVRWIHGYATELPEIEVDLATMTANVAQVFLTDADWAATLGAAYRALRPGGRLVFETRDPAAKAWEDWTEEKSRERCEVPGIGWLDTWHYVTAVGDGLVTFRWTMIFESDGEVLTSDSTLRFRTREEVEQSLAAAGFHLDERRDAPDRPGREIVFVARRP